MTTNTKQTGMAKPTETAGAMMNREEPTKKLSEKIVTWVNRVGKRDWIIIGAVLLIGVALWLNWMFFSDNTVNAGYADYDTSGGMVGENVQNGADVDTTADYFATVAVSRQQARDESLEVLQNVLDSEDASEEVKNQALAEMQVIAGEIEKEANVEALLISKGFEDCVAVMNGNSIHVVVRSEGDLQTAQIAQINTVVYEQTGIEPLNVTISHKN